MRADSLRYILPVIDRFLAQLWGVPVYQKCSEKSSITQANNANYVANKEGLHTWPMSWIQFHQ